MKRIAKTFQIETKRRRVKAAQPARAPRKSPHVAPVNIQMGAPPLMTRAAPKETAARGGPPPADQSRAASLTPGSYDETARTFGVVLSTFADVQRFGIMERLNSDPAAWDLSRVEAGQVKLLDSHNQSTIAAVLGTLLDARFEGGQLVGTVALADSEAARAIEPDIASGHLRGISIGYAVRQWTLVSSGEVDVWQADRVVLMEASIVSIPADAGAMIRAADDVGALAPYSPPPRVEMTPRQTLELLQRADFYGQRELAERLISEGRSESFVVTAVRAARLETSEALAAIGAPRAALYSQMNTLGGRKMQTESTIENPRFRNDVTVDFIRSRIGPHEAKPETLALLGGRSLHEAAQFCSVGFSGRGWTAREAEEAVFGRAATHSTSDFPVALSNALRLSIIDQMSAARTGALDLVARTVPVSDFRDNTAVAMGPYPSLKEVKEGGEIQGGTIADNGEKFKIASYASSIGFTLQAWRNDSLGALAQAVRNIAFPVVDLKANLILSALNASMSDSLAFFHASHGNLAGAGAVLSVTSLGEGRAAMRNQKPKGSTAPLNVQPAILLVSTAQETAAEQLLTSIQATQASNVNPFAGRLALAVEPRLTGTAWYLFSNPLVYETIRFAALDGADAPKVEQNEPFDTLGIEWRVHWHVGAAPVDFRGAWKNPGA